MKLVGDLSPSLCIWTSRVRRARSRDLGINKKKKKKKEEVCSKRAHLTMAVSETTHASEGVDATDERVQTRTRSRKTGPLRWIIGVVVR